MSQTGENNERVKVALLIGVSESGLTPLPAAIKDVKAMQRVLNNSEIGGFTVRSLPNPERQAMEEAIETLFEDRQKNDLVLLYFSGHGIKDENGRLYFATRSTRKNEKGGLVQATVVSASFVQEIMRKSPSKRQVVILDCCFSGAFAEDMRVKDDGSVDVVNQLGGEGRAILTSSTSTQYSFEQKGSELSIYTRYLVEGIETGAADTNDNGVITVDELHEYAKKKVQEAAPRMRPEIYPVKEGFTIKLAKAPLGDPRLRYRKEVELFSRRGEISPTGRTALEQFQVKLKLSSEEAIVIENEVLQPYREYQKRLQEYEQALVKEVERKYPISSDTQVELQRLQQILGLRNEDVEPIQTHIIAEQEKKDVATPINENYLISIRRRFRQYIGVLSIGIVGIIIGGTVVSLMSHTPLINSCANKQYVSDNNISLGDKILVQEDRNPNKESGVKALAKGNCENAIQNFNSSLKDNRNDPEALIYLNNAKSRLGVAQLTIAVSVPIGRNPNVAKEILRGVAQAQDEVNRDNGINGKLLQVEIANDNNEPTLAQNIATQFVNDASILAVVGHNASEASISAAPVYQQRGLVMISPTSFALNSDEIGNYIFRTVPRSDVLAVTLSNYVTNKIAKNNIAICFDSKSIEAQSFKTIFKKTIEAAGRNVNPTHCDFSDSNFNPIAVISQAINTGADGLFLAPHINRIQKALELAKANQASKRRLDLFGNSTLYTNQTLKDGQANVNGIILVVTWYPTATSDNSFLTNSKQLWGGLVTWRTAMAYKATKAIITGLQQNTTREGLQQAMQSQTLSNGNAILVKVRSNPRTDTGYEFVQLK
ncbi:ABC transporter substrate-binding protein [Scytonema hofmannii PCC 7110]|uniref:ABC transporter substrate-binding protein n=1 Tax=Scytonema hofmannii PCC 7110 TaxID=128403 RepID=A0A139X534_9CYAN|nr:ABC transporter substrate-binding protein [Scytonema hofmannii]KYC39800.1 ABC transporter substrate-binding protein [Scytonema hofmannii PCC 7110]